METPGLHMLSLPRRRRSNFFLSMKKPEETIANGKEHPLFSLNSTFGPKRVIHKFNEIIATTYRSIPVALLFQYVRYRCAEDGQTHDVVDPETDLSTGTTEISYRSKVITLADVMRLFPYFGQKQAFLALRRLWSRREPIDVAPLLSRSRIPHTQFYKYRVREDAYDDVPDLRESALHRLCPEVAKEIGIVPAIVVENVRYHILRNWDEAARKNNHDHFKTVDRADHYIAPAAWQESHRYVSVRTAFRAFDVAERSGHLVRKGVRYGRIPVWTLPKKELEAYAKLHMSGHPDHSKKENLNILKDNDL